MHLMDGSAEGRLVVLVRLKRSDDTITFLHGDELGTERMVRREVTHRGQLGDGFGVSVILYEGERGVERRVFWTRLPVWVGNQINFGCYLEFQGEKGAERKVRMVQEWPHGKIFHFEGERGAERMVRAEEPNGFESEMGAERPSLGGMVGMRECAFLAGTERGVDTPDKAAVAGPSVAGLLGMNNWKMPPPRIGEWNARYFLEMRHSNAAFSTL